MIPDTAEGDIFWRRKQRAGYRPTCRAGAPSVSLHGCCKGLRKRDSSVTLERCRHVHQAELWQKRLQLSWGAPGVHAGMQEEQQEPLH